MNDSVYQESDFLDLCGICKNAIEANELLFKENFELIFLDIKMPELSGIDWLKSLPTPPLVIVTTAYREYALDSFDMNVLDYLLKPISFERFLKAVNKAYELFSLRSKGTTESSQVITGSDDDFFFIKSSNGYLRLGYADVLFIEAVKDFVSIQTIRKKHLVLVSMKNAEKLLNKEKFIRTHRSYIISIAKVDAVEGNTLLISGRPIPISKQYQQEVFDKLLRHKVWRRDGNQ